MKRFLRSLSMGVPLEDDLRFKGFPGWKVPSLSGDEMSCASFERRVHRADNPGLMKFDLDFAIKFPG
jgi:hypothetical protein